MYQKPILVLLQAVGTRMTGKTIGQVADETGCSIETIRFYEKAKLIPKPVRSSGGHRVFSEDAVRRIRFIRRSRDLGFSLDEIKKILMLLERNTLSTDSVRGLVENHLKGIQAKIDDLKMMEATFKGLKSQCLASRDQSCSYVLNLDVCPPAFDMNQR